MVSRITPALPLLLVACAGGGDSGFSPNIGGGGDGSGADDTGEPPDYDCPDGMVEVPATTADLGETLSQNITLYEATTIPQITVSTSGYCVDRYPLPGREGAAWPPDGLGHDQVATLEAALPAWGRRLCTVSELMMAGTGPDNWRYPYDPANHIDGACDPESSTPLALGTYPDCRSPLGVRDLNVKSSWGTLDAAVKAVIEPYYIEWEQEMPGGGAYGVWGGTSQQNTFHSPDNYGIHFYGPGDPSYPTDGIRVCANVGKLDEATEAAWATQMDAIESAGTLAGWIETL